MIQAIAANSAGMRLVDALVSEGIDTFTGVPCSYLKTAFGCLERLPQGGSGRWYVRAQREDTAVGIAVGCSLGGRQPAVLMQNSGLGYCLNSLTSLVQIYRIPMVLVVTWRGGGPGDAVEHDIIGPRLIPLLDAVGIPSTIGRPSDIEAAVATTARTARTQQAPSVLVVPDGF